MGKRGRLGLERRGNDVGMMMVNVWVSLVMNGIDVMMMMMVVVVVVLIMMMVMIMIHVIMMVNVWLMMQRWPPSRAAENSRCRSVVWDG